MHEHTRRVCVALFLFAGLLLAGLAPAASSAQPRLAPALTISPDANYVGGQALTFSGNIGATGERRIGLQKNAWYSGGVWGDVDGFHTTTEANGDFSFVYPAPAMTGIRYRVASGKLATPSVTLDARSQDLVVTPDGDPTAGAPFDLLVDTTPTLTRRPDTIGLQPTLGRPLTLQERVTPTTWTALDTTEVGPLGLAKFTVTEAVGGVHVYRVVQEDWFGDGNRIGWFPSFPAYVDVLDTASPRAGTATSDSSTWSATPATVTPTAAAPVQRALASTNRTTASKTYRWGQGLFDFAWEFGESLSSGPSRGTVRQGSWDEYNDGGGRISSHNGGLYLDSKRVNKPGPGDFGTTMTTMRGNPMTYGRWEVRVRARSEETGANDYIVRAELVPERAGDYDCGAHNITIGELTAHASSILVGVNAGDRRWTSRKSVGGTNAVQFALATEVAKRHITWFINGKPVATVNSARAVSDLPMTLRLSMVGNGQEEMNDLDILSDWQRGFSLLRGTQVTDGPRMQARPYTGGC